MSIIDIDTTESIHRAAQYLAIAGINYLENKENDSHTNMGWDKERNAFITRNLNGNKLYLGLNLNNFRLEFLRNDLVLASKPIAGSRHREIMEWLNEVFRDLGFETPFRFNLHYDLPYDGDQSDFMYEDPDTDELRHESELRMKAYEILNHVKADFQDSSEIRTWPHHFDTGGVIHLGGEHSIGIGMSAPNMTCDEHHFYVSGWKGDESKEVQDFPKLKNGKWIEGEWNGGIIKASSSDEKIISFFKEAFEYLK